MSEDWQPGDIALCVLGGDITPNVPKRDWVASGHPVSGAFYTVGKVSVRCFIKRISLGLELLDGPTKTRLSTGYVSRFWAAERFVKVSPPEADEYDREVIDLMVGEPVA